MSLHISSLIIPGAIVIRNNAEKLVTNISSDIFSSKPTIGGVKINCNHPAFIFGHLSLYPARVFKLLDIEEPSITPPKDYYDKFAIGTECHDDPEQKIYPPKEELLSFFLKSTDFVIQELPKVPGDIFFRDNVEERTKDRFPILGSFIFYLLSTHANGHLGQLSTWRRCMGLGPV